MLISKWAYALRRLARSLWLRSGLYAVLGVATALVAMVIGPFLPDGLADKVGAGSVDGILNILASSMLAVTTFSLSIIVSAFSGATSTVTPRAVALLMEDRTAQQVLSTFLGGFLFSLVGLIALQAGVYGANGRLVLFAATILVIVVIVLAMLRWISHLMRFGRVGDTTERVADAARKAIEARVAAPYLGGHPLVGAAPVAAAPILSDRTGYVRHVDTGALQDCAAAADGKVYLAALPGSFVHLAAPLARVEGDVSAEAVRKAFTIGDTRSFDQDPRFGLCVLAEIAQRALSPAVNDPGTAIDVLGRVVGLMHPWARRGSATLSHPRVWVPPIQVADLFDDVFPPIAREGAGVLAVQLRLQKTLLALARLDPAAFGAAAAEHATRALAEATPALFHPADRDRLAAAAAEVAASASQTAGHQRGV